MIYVLGGGASKGPIKKGTIVVTYPSGATCTVTNGSKTYTALDTSGTAAFAVDAGTWTVTVVNGSETESQSVTVTAKGWVEVELGNKVIFENGVTNSAAGSWEAKGMKMADNAAGGYVGSPTVSFTDKAKLEMYGGQYQCGIVYLSNKLNLSNHSKLNVTFGALVGNPVRVAVWTDIPAFAEVNLVASVDAVANSTQSLDISSLSTSYNIGFILNTGTGASLSAEVAKIAFE